MGAGVLRPGILPLLPGSMMFPPFMVIVTLILPRMSTKVNPGQHRWREKTVGYNVVRLEDGALYGHCPKEKDETDCAVYFKGHLRFSRQFLR